MAALVTGTVLAIGALAFVLYPVLFATAPTPKAPRAREADGTDAALSALREIEFDRATGKLSDGDYTGLKQRYTESALFAMRREADAARAVVATTDDEIEAALLAYRKRLQACTSCGPRPEPGALYCSSCGKHLTTSCAHCGAPVGEDDARFCPNCGQGLRSEATIVVDDDAAIAPGLAADEGRFGSGPASQRRTARARTRTR